MICQIHSCYSGHLLMATLTFHLKRRKCRSYENSSVLLTIFFCHFCTTLNGHSNFFKRKFFIYFTGFYFYKTLLGFNIKSNCLLICNFSFIRCCATFNGGFFQNKVTQLYVPLSWHFVSAIIVTVKAFSF